MAERIPETGLKAVDERMDSVRRIQGNEHGDMSRVHDDRVTILPLLKRLHQIYQEEDRLKNIGRLLHEAGVRH